MALSLRERSTTYVVLAACAVFIGDRLVLQPYLDERKALVEQRLKSRQSLDQAQKILDTEQRLRRKVAILSNKIKGDPASAEAQLLHLINEFEQQAGVGSAAFQRIHATEEHGYTNLGYHVSAAGSMPAVAMLLYRIETAGIPLRVDEVVVSPKRDVGDELIVQMNLSTLARPEKPDSGTTVAAAEGTR